MILVELLKGFNFLSAILFLWEMQPIRLIDIALNCSISNQLYQISVIFVATSVSSSLNLAHVIALILFLHSELKK